MMATIYMQVIPTVKGKNISPQPPEISSVKRFNLLGKD
jgi:hypothetical protein